jgi:raffinose/stachyose/melibiose transport system substrate-binding protein
MKKGSSMRSNRRITAILGASVLLSTAVLTGCTSGGGGQEEPSSLSFVTWLGDEGLAKWQTAADAFEEATGTHIEIESIPFESYDQVVTSRIEAGNAPDLMESVTEKQALLTGADLLEDLSDQPWVSDQIPAVADFAASYYDGKTYAFIPALDSAGVFYNVDLFEAQGVEVPTTWDEFLDVVGTFRAAGITPLAVGAKDGWPLNVQANEFGTSALAGSDETTDLLNGDLAYADSSWEGILTAWSDLIAAGGYNPDALGMDYNASAAEFAGGEAAMFIQGSFAIPSIRAAAPDLNMSVFPLPYGHEGDDRVASVGFGSMLAVPKTAPNLAGAKEFLTFLTDPEVLTPFLEKSAAFSGITGITPQLDPSLDALAALVESNSAEYNLAGGTTAPVNAALSTGVQGLMSGTMTVADVLASMDRARTS